MCRDIITSTFSVLRQAWKNRSYRKFESSWHEKVIERVIAVAKVMSRHSHKTSANAHHVLLEMYELLYKA